MILLPQFTLKKKPSILPAFRRDTRLLQTGLEMDRRCGSGDLPVDMGDLTRLALIDLLGHQPV